MNKKTIMRKHLNELLEKLASEASNSVMATKLRKIDSICDDLVDKGVIPSVVLVVKYLTEAGLSLSKRTIYNERKGGNPYKTLIEEWIQYANAITDEKETKTKSSPSLPSAELLEDSDLEAIPDPVLRYRVSLMFGEMKGLRNQLNIAREISNLPPIHASPVLQEIGIEQADQILLGEYELELIQSLLNGNASIDFDDEGSLIAKSSIRKGTKVSSPGLRTALEKVLNSYRPNLIK